MYEMDSTDLQIIEILKEDGRASFSFIANKVHLSRVAVRERIKIMKENGIIHGFTVIIDAKAYKKMVAVFMDIEVDPSRIDAIAEELMKKKEIAIISQHTGNAGLHVHAYIDNVETLHSYLENNIYNIRGVKSVNAQLLIHQYRTTAYLARYEE